MRCVSYTTSVDATAHFEEDLEPDEKLAAPMLQLLEDFLSYLYVLPREIEDLNTRIEGLRVPKATG